MAAEEKRVDVLVIGSGAAGLTAAVTAARAGLEVLVAEKDRVFGGTTATSGGVIWIPGNHHAEAALAREGRTDPIAAARRYLEIEAGQHIDHDRVDAYLSEGPRMVRFMERETEVRFQPLPFPDYHPEEEGAGDLRSLASVEYDAAKMGRLMPRLKGELPQTLFLGLALGSSLEMKQFMAAGRSLSAMGFVVRRMTRHFADLARHGQSQSIVRGRALIARLLRSAADQGVTLWHGAPAMRLIREEGRVVGAEIARSGGSRIVRARHGVVLAAGGYPRDKARRARHHPGLAATMEPATPVPMGNTGDSARMAEEVGARFNGNLAQAAAWMPVSTLPGATDFTGVWPHLVERTKPGFLMVLPTGERFCNESSSYHDLVPAMLDAFERTGTDAAWLIGDARAVRRWGMGFARPFPVPKGRYVRMGYLLRGRSLSDLARQAGIDATALTETVRRFNGFAAAGQDPDFRRGESAYDRHHGDAENAPSPSLGALTEAPFYAVRILPGEISSYKGLATDRAARVLDTADRPIPGLYAVGNDQANVFGGAYPGAGATIGPCMVFGWLAARDIAESAGRSLPGEADAPAPAA